MVSYGLQIHFYTGKGKSFTFPHSKTFMIPVYLKRIGTFDENVFAFRGRKAHFVSNVIEMISYGSERLRKIMEKI